MGRSAAYCKRRGLLAIDTVRNQIGYHLYEIPNPSNSKYGDDQVRLLRRSRWPTKESSRNNSLRVPYLIIITQRRGIGEFRLSSRRTIDSNLRRGWKSNSQ